MAIPAKIVGDGAPKVAFLVAFFAGQRCVLSDQAKLREVVAEAGGGTVALPAALPASGVVTPLALFAEVQGLKSPVVLVRVTALAAAVRQSLEEKHLLGWTPFCQFLVDLSLGDEFCPGPGVAFDARKLLMHAGELKGGAGVVEPRGWFPRLGSVAAEAVWSELFLMRLLMARCALAAQTEEGSVKISHSDLRPGCSRDPVCRMATLASLFTMLAFQCEARPGTVIETPPVQGNELEPGSAMFWMAPSAIGRARGALVGAPVEARALFHPAPDLTVAFEAFQTARPEIVARSASGEAAQIGVSARQRAGRYLAMSDATAKRHQCEDAQAPRHDP